jgi:3-hydroxyacyl-CoA dehydrogenase
MGSGIAEVCARAGLDVTVWEIDDAALAAGRTLARVSSGASAEPGQFLSQHRRQLRGLGEVRRVRRADMPRLSGPLRE